MKRIIEQPLVFPIGDKDYTVAPVGIDDGWQLTEILNATPAKRTRVKTDDLFRLALGPVYDQMREDGVGLDLAFRAGMAALAHFQALTAGGTHAAALTAAEAIWESGLDPKALAAWVEKHQPTTPEPPTAAAGASTANTSGTSTRKASSRSPRKTAAPKSTSRTSSSRRTSS